MPSFFFFYLWTPQCHVFNRWSCPPVSGLRILSQLINCKQFIFGLLILSYWLTGPYKCQFRHCHACSCFRFFEKEKYESFNFVLSLQDYVSYSRTLAIPCQQINWIPSKSKLLWGWHCGAESLIATWEADTPNRASIQVLVVQLCFQLMCLARLWMMPQNVDPSFPHTRPGRISCLLSLSLSHYFLNK